MIFVTVAMLYKKADCGFDGKAITSIHTRCSTEEEARRHMIANTDVVKEILGEWMLTGVYAYKVKPEELLTDDDLIKAFVIEMARMRDQERGEE